MPARGGLEVEPTTRPRPNRPTGKECTRGTPRVQSPSGRGCGDTRPSLCVGSRPSKTRNDVSHKCGARNHRHTARGVNVAGPVPIGPDSVRHVHQTQHDSTVHGSPEPAQHPAPPTTYDRSSHSNHPRHTVIIHRFQIVAVVHLHATVDTFSLSLRLPAGTHDPTPHSPGEPQCRSV